MDFPPIDLRAAFVLVIGLMACTAVAQPNTPFYILEGEAKDAKLGAYVARVPDVTGDGVDEIVAGSHRYDGLFGVDSGRVKLFDGATGAVLWRVDGEAPGGLFGHDVWGIADVNGDGRGDVIASAYRFNFTSRIAAGKVYVLSGKDGSIIWKRDGENGGDEFGYALTSVPDIDGDKIEDVVAGAWNNDTRAREAGKAYVLSGKNGSIIRVHVGLAANHRFGCAAAGFRDLNRDGRGDYVIGALHAGPAGEGQIYLHDGKTGAVILTLTGERPTDLFGWSVAAVPDADGDGLEDLFVGARDHDPLGTRTDAGRAYLFNGATGKRLHVFDGEISQDKFGRFGAGVPDADGDGYGDLIVGAYNHVCKVRSGAAYLFSGRSGKTLRKYCGEETSNLFGFAACGLNDVNGDGLGDVAVGAYQYRPNASRTESRGRVYVYTAGLTGIVTTLSTSRGGGVPLLIDAGPANARRFFLVVATLSGTHPGFSMQGNLHVPINFDPLTLASWYYANSPILVNTFDKTDARGKSIAALYSEPGVFSMLVGRKMSFCWALVDGKLDVVSNPFTVDLLP